MRCSRSCTWMIPCGFYKGLDGEEEKTWRWSSTCAEHLESSCSFAKGSVEQMRFGSERAWSSSWPRKWWYFPSRPRWWTRWNRRWRAGTTRAWCRSERSERWQGSCHGSAASLCEPGGASTSCTRSSQTLVDVRMENERASKREDTRPKPFMAAVHRMELPRRWFIAMSDKPDKFALRREPLRQVPAQFALITDASPRGVGAIFADMDRQSRAIVPLEALEIPFTEEYARWMGIPWDDPAGQGPLEAWAVLMAIKKWKHRIRGQAVLIRADSVVALATVARASAPSPVLNWIGAELALKAEELCLRKFITQHIPGAWNVEADWLSRPHQRGPIPKRLGGVPMRQFPKERIMTSAWTPLG